MAIAKQTEEAKKATPNGDKSIATKPDQKPAIYAPATEEGWVIGDTGEDRMYYSMEAGNVLEGHATGLDMFEGDDGNARTFVKTQLTRPCWVVLAKKKGEEKGERVLAPIGSLVWLGIRHGLIPLYEKVERSVNVLKIAVLPKEKVDIGKGQTVWRAAWGYRATNQRAVIERPIAQPEEAGDVPF